MQNEIVRSEQNSVSERDLSIITSEIKYYWHMGQQTALMCIIEIGRRLCEAKSLVAHGGWGVWLSENFEFSQSNANNFMRLFDEYGADQMSIFGATVDSQTFANLPYSKALQLLAIPREEREEFAKEVGAEDLSVRELKKAIEERKAAEQAAAEAEEREHELEQKLASAEIAKAEAEKKARLADEARAKVEKLEADLQKKKEGEKKLKEKLKDAQENPVISDEVRSRITAEAEEKARAQKAAELEDQLSRAREAQKAAEQAMAEAEAQAKEAMDKLANAQKKLKMASPAVTEFKVLFVQAQEIVQKLKEKLGVIMKEDPETAKKLLAALHSLGESLDEK